MDNCKHVQTLTPSADHSILNPQKWLCSVCGTTESVWACLSCSNVACGRYNEEHALNHFKDSRHPLAIEVNEKYIFCYVCDDYVLNDDAAGEIKILRSALSAIATQSFNDLENNKRGNLLRSHSYHGFGTGFDQEKILRYQDQSYTVLKFHRYYLLARPFAAWRGYVNAIKEKKSKAELQTEKPSLLSRAPTLLYNRSESLTEPARKKGPIMPGVVGLRNLGNTCYMNSILQVISHLKDLRDFFLSLQHVLETCAAANAANRNSASTSQSSPPRVTRQTTVECFQYLNEGTGQKKRGGLNGGGSPKGLSRHMVASSTRRSPRTSLCDELHALLRVLWSGKWALVSPHKMLYAVWTVIPFFKGYAQQDAQEFLCELLDKVERELRAMFPAENPNRDSILMTPIKNMRDIVDKVFSGQLCSEVTCLVCGHKSRTYEPFMDLSLEFPVKYHTKLSTQGQCHIKEMLEKFTETEHLDGKIYACEQCNKRRRRSTNQPTVLTEAKKRMMLNKLPQILRLHLKRFMWSGRNHRGKISVHVKFDELLDMGPYCYQDNQPDGTRYKLSAVVMHHGRGFGSGHYTAYCWNEEAESWVHCNDARLQLVGMKDVIKSQAYILFFSKMPDEEDSDGLSQPLRALFEEQADEEIVFNFRNSTIPRFVELKRRLSEPGFGGPVLKRRRSNIW